MEQGRLQELLYAVGLSEEGGEEEALRAVVGEGEVAEADVLGKVALARLRVMEIEKNARDKEEAELRNMISHVRNENDNPEFLGFLMCLVHNRIREAVEERDPHLPEMSLRRDVDENIQNKYYDLEGYVSRMSEAMLRDLREAAWGRLIFLAEIKGENNKGLREQAADTLKDAIKTEIEISRDMEFLDVVQGVAMYRAGISPVTMTASGTGYEYYTESVEKLSKATAGWVGRLARSRLVDLGIERRAQIASSQEAPEAVSPEGPDTGAPEEAPSAGFTGKIEPPLPPGVPPLIIDPDLREEGISIGERYKRISRFISTLHIAHLREFLNKGIIDELLPDNRIRAGRLKMLAKRRINRIERFIGEHPPESLYSGDILGLDIPELEMISAGNGYDSDQERDARSAIALKSGGQTAPSVVARAPQIPRPEDAAQGQADLAGRVPEAPPRRPIPIPPKTRKSPAGERVLVAEPVTGKGIVGQVLSDKGFSEEEAAQILPLFSRVLRHYSDEKLEDDEDLRGRLATRAGLEASEFNVIVWRAFFDAAGKTYYGDVEKIMSKVVVNGLRRRGITDGSETRRSGEIVTLLTDYLIKRSGVRLEEFDLFLLSHLNAAETSYKSSGAPVQVARAAAVPLSEPVVAEVMIPTARVDREIPVFAEVAEPEVLPAVSGESIPDGVMTRKPGERVILGVLESRGIPNPEKYLRRFGDVEPLYDGGKGKTHLILAVQAEVKAIERELAEAAVREEALRVAASPTVSTPTRRSPAGALAPPMRRSPAGMTAEQRLDYARRLMPDEKTLGVSAREKPAEYVQGWWENWLEKTSGMDKEVVGELMQNLFGGEPAMVIIPIASEERSELLGSQLRGASGKVRAALEYLVMTYNAGNITFNLYNEEDAHDERKRREIIGLARGIKKDRVITFAYTWDEGFPEFEKAYPEFRENSYTIFLQGPPDATTTTPIGKCGLMGLALLNYRNLQDRTDDLAVLKAARDTIVKSYMSLTGEDDPGELAKKIFDEDDNLKLSGEILVSIRPIDTQEIRDFHETEAQVLKAL
ncbi:hypothetical protein ACFL3N_02780 [Candidatus Omnitrophota bacterium]